MAVLRAGDARRVLGRLAVPPRGLALAACLEDSATVLLAAGHAPAAITKLTEAASISSAIGAAGDLARVESALRRLGVRTNKQRPSRPSFGWASLTPTEMAVSELVSRGMTNPDIGTRLYVSRRTVETHLAHIFRKLDLANRSQLAAEKGGAMICREWAA